MRALSSGCRRRRTASARRPAARPARRRRVVHRVVHVVDEARQPAVDVGDLGSGCLSTGSPKSRIVCVATRTRLTGVCSAPRVRRAAGRPRCARAVGRGRAARRARQRARLWSGARTSHVPSVGPEHLDACGRRRPERVERGDRPPSPAPDTAGQRAERREAERRARRCARPRPPLAGRACRPRATTSWSGRRVCTSSRDRGRRPPTSRARAASRAMRLLGGAVARREQLLVEVEERDDRVGAATTRCSTASVPTCTSGRAQLVAVGRRPRRPARRPAPRAPRGRGSHRPGGSERVLRSAGTPAAAPSRTAGTRSRRSAARPPHRTARTWPARRTRHTRAVEPGPCG